MINLILVYLIIQIISIFFSIKFKNEFQSLFIDVSDIEDRTLFKVENDTKTLELVE